MAGEISAKLAHLRAPITSLDFSEEEIRRYSRHIVLPEVGGAGQKRINRASVLVVGAGGLGSPVALYLAAAGVGKIGIVDNDVVDTSNLQRQILHSTATVGKKKVESARDTLLALNPNLEVTPHDVRLNSGNILQILKGYDVVAEGSDNFPTKFLVNDACVMTGTPVSMAGIFRFSGQLLTVIPRHGPCYRCLIPQPPPPGAVPSCQEAGVFGAMAGVVGVIQATEILKLILGKGEVLNGRLLLFEALQMRFEPIELKRNPECPVCSETPSITELIDYELACEVQQSAASPSSR
ncbi:MAG TPA: molybdopterin-synthase adenylyltransferase MoeB [Candidatus Tectomicrobia bacterium]|nr:molybdopterin-synthase adenylyltransferase MoeB [Candidatus Tectomicrobia bacterium]